MPPKDLDIDRATHRSKERFILQIAKAKEAERDSEKNRAKRQKLQECQYCFYYGHGLAGQAFTNYKCQGCGETKSYHCTSTPKLCDECAAAANACARCGADMNLKFRTGQIPEPRKVEVE